jgi:capsular exopolysaccharide synthesis family protein
MQIVQQKSLEKDKNLIKQLWFKYIPYWPLFFIFSVLAIAGAWFFLKYTTPLYQSTASILIKDEKKGQDDSKMEESLNQLSSKKIVENEIEVLKSRELMTEVVKNLHLYAPVYQSRKLRPVSAYATSPIIIESIDPNSIKGADKKIFFSFDQVRAQVVIGNKYYKLNEWASTPYGTLKFIPQNVQSTAKSKNYENYPLYFSLINPKTVALSLLGNLDVSSSSKLTSIVHLKIKDEVPKKADDILNNLMEVYNKASVNDKNSLAINTLTFVDSRLKSVSHDLDSIEKKLEQYKSTNDAIDISSQGAMFLQNVSNVDQKLGDVNMQLAVLGQVEDYVKSKDNAGGIVPSTVGVTDPLLSQLLEKLYDLELEREKLKKTTPENNPLMVSITNQIDKVKPSILENIKSQKASLEASKGNLNVTNNKFSSILGGIPQKEKDLVEISREQNVLSGIYNFLLQKKEEAQMSLSATINDSRIIDKAQSSVGPVYPNSILIYAAALIIALALVMGIISLREIFKRTILFRQEIESFTSIPVIGEIAYEKSKEPLVIGNGRRTFIAEQFRNLRITLPYTGINKERKKLLVTSSVSGEGKSFIVANLGVSLALTGKKVVVIEFDLSEPTLSKKLNVTTIDKGLTDYLRDDEVSPEEIIYKAEVEENLYIIPAGDLPENPSEIIMSERVPELLEYLSTVFDYIIMDTAPVGLLSDAYVLSAYSDATLYVVRHSHTRKISIQRLDENNKINPLKNTAIVFNGIRPRGFNRNGYGYGYGYGYLYNEKRKKKGAKS